MRTALLVPAVSAALVVGGAPLALAAPPAQEVIDLHCEDGETYPVVVNGNGAWTPGRVQGSTAVVVPVAFEDLRFRAESPGGEVLQEGTEPGDVKGRVADRSPRPTTPCTFEIRDVLEEDDPESGLPAGTVLFFGGTVVVQVTGAR